MQKHGAPSPDPWALNAIETEASARLAGVLERISAGYRLDPDFLGRLPIVVRRALEIRGGEPPRLGVFLSVRVPRRPYRPRAPRQGHGKGPGAAPAPEASGSDSGPVAAAGPVTAARGVRHG